jgi:predicted nucleotidyltransferase component of viral defense system
MKQLSRADATLLSDLREADEQLGRLPEAMLEKDVFITEASLALGQLSDQHVRVVFCGGTSLSKAHRLIERMSEDVDFKLDVRPTESKNARRNLLRGFRDRALAALKELGYEIDAREHVKSRDASTYTSIQLHYTTRFTAHAAIRPHVQIELNAFSPRVATRELEIQTLVSRDRLGLSCVGRLHCLDVSETMAEKLISFTRRTAQYLAGKNRAPFDSTLVRHLYDVHQLLRAQAVDETIVYRLASEISSSDAQEFKGQHPEYEKDPIGETRRALAALDTDRQFSEWYMQYVDAMIYGDAKPPYGEVIRAFKDSVSRALGIPQASTAARAL